MIHQNSFYYFINFINNKIINKIQKIFLNKLKQKLIKIKFVFLKKQNHNELCNFEINNLD